VASPHHADAAAAIRGLESSAPPPCDTGKLPKAESLDGSDSPRVQ
jgi:hypothetical protein